MAWHKRYINKDAKKDTKAKAPRVKNRLLVEFCRADYLWISPHPLINPFLGHPTPCPVWLSGSLAVGPNILDAIERVTMKVWEDAEVQTPDGSMRHVTDLVEKPVWRLRDPQEFFPTREEEASDDHPFHKSYCTGGTAVAEEDGFLRVEKISTVSISTLVYKLAVGMTGSTHDASRHIGAIAAEAWAADIDRARRLYELIRSMPQGILADADVPDELQAVSSVGQMVETAVLRETCHWLGIDPDSPIERRRGRPRKQRNEAGESMAAGQLIELTLHDNGSVTGRLLKDYLGIPKGTSLAGLTLTKLAEMLVALRESELVDDADLLEAYLEAADPDWRAKIADEIGVENGGEAKPDPWTLLGLEPGATLEEVKKAYRTIVRVIHPDASPLPRWYAQTVNDAYRQLLQELES